MKARGRGEGRSDLAKSHFKIKVSLLDFVFVDFVPCDCAIPLLLAMTSNRRC